MDGRPSRENKASFSNLLGALWTQPGAGVDLQGTEGLAVKIKLHFQIYPAHCGRSLGQVLIYKGRKA